MKSQFFLAAAAAGWLIAGAVQPALAAAATPETVGVSSAALAQLDADMRALVESGRRAGIVYGVVRRGQLLVLRAHGLRDREAQRPMTVDTVFRLYSQSRAVTSAAILTLVQNRQLRLDDKVAKYLPEIGRMQVVSLLRDGKIVATVPQQPAMTVRHLLQYSAGLGYAADWPKSVGMNQREILDLDGDLATTVTRLSKFPLLDQPGSRWRYGFSSDVLGRIAEVVSGKPFNVFLRESLTGPLGMADTDFWVGPDDTQRLATVYAPATGGGLRPTAAIASSTYDRPSRMFSAGGGLVSTVPDYLRFGQMLLARGSLGRVQVLKPATVALMSRNTLTPAMGGEVYWYREDWSAIFRGYGWGLGIGVRLPERIHTVSGSVGDLGWGGLASTSYFIDPKRQLVAVVMSQYLGPDGDRPAYVLREGVYRALLD